MFDFNPRNARQRDSDYLGTPEYQDKVRALTLQGKRLVARQNMSAGQTRPLVEIIGSDLPTVLKKGFKVPVESRLPYRVVTKSQTHRAEGWTIDGEYIIGINVIDHGSVDSVEDEDEEICDKIVIFKLRT
ncbi:hypothetical protein FRC11_008779 [Ceratobasidium sp. 423]|nr:hypothetical protein FRC11_008779 [Ceratobasidium sp. 423]